MRVGVDFDPVVPHRRVDLLAGGLGDDHGCRFNRHVAIDAVGCNSVAKLLGDTARLPLMAAKTLSRVASRCLLRRVRVVARRASHGGRGQEAATALQQTHLIAVDIGMLDDRGGNWLEELKKRPARDIRKRGSNRLSLNAFMA